VTAGDRTDRVDHREQRELEGERDAEVSDLQPRDDGRADTAENQDERIGELRGRSLPLSDGDDLLWNATYLPGNR